MTTKRDGFDVCPFDPVSAFWSTQLEHWGIVRWWVGAPPHTEQRLVCGWQGKAGKDGGTHGAAALGAASGAALADAL